MLFLRRAAGESITLLGPRGFHYAIRIVSIDVARQTARIFISPVGTHDIARRESPTGTYDIARQKPVELFCGLVSLEFSLALDYQGIYPNAVNLGIEAPRYIRIHRTEKLAGLGPDQLRAMGGGRS